MKVIAVLAMAAAGSAAVLRRRRAQQAERETWARATEQTTGT
jgi:hypothetical protein